MKTYIVTCGTCDRSWDDAISTQMTPAPSGRCPFEYFHDGEPVPKDWPVQPIESTRRCGVCSKIIYYGLYCSNQCSDEAYLRWKADRRDEGRRYG